MGKRLIFCSKDCLDAMLMFGSGVFVANRGRGKGRWEGILFLGQSRVCEQCPKPFLAIYQRFCNRVHWDDSELCNRMGFALRRNQGMWNWLAGSLQRGRFEDAETLRLWNKPSIIQQQ